MYHVEPCRTIYLTHTSILIINHHDFGKEAQASKLWCFLTSIGCVTLKNDSVAREKRWQRMQICVWPGCIDDLKVVVHDWFTDENPKIAFNSGWETERNWSRFVVPHPTILQRHEFPRFRFFLHCGTLPCCRMSPSTHASQTHSFGNGSCRAMTSDCTRMVSYVQICLYFLLNHQVDLAWAEPKHLPFGKHVQRSSMCFLESGRIVHCLF